MKHLFIDDCRMPGHVTWVRLPSATYDIVRSYGQFIEYVKENGLPEFITFDHDLDEFDGSDKTGYDIVLWIIDSVLDGKLVIPDNFSFMVHSMNPVGKANIEATLRNFINFIKSN